MALPSALAAPPSWWENQGITSGSAQIKDYAAINQGQLKTIVRAAMRELDAALPNGAGTKLRGMIQRWEAQSGSGTSRDFGAVNIGQVKTAATLVYERLIAERHSVGFPWASASATSADYALANLGQVKTLFAFDLRHDSDDDGLPDWWEMAWLFTLDFDETDNPDNDQLNNALEFRNGTDPMDPSSGTLSRVRFLAGVDQFGWTSEMLPAVLSVEVSDAKGKPLAGIALRVLRMEGDGSLARVDGTPLPGTSADFLSDSVGRVAFRYVAGPLEIVHRFAVTTGDIPSHAAAATAARTAIRVVGGSAPPAPTNLTIAWQRAGVVRLEWETGGPPPPSGSAPLAFSVEESVDGSQWSGRASVLPSSPSWTGAVAPGMRLRVTAVNAAGEALSTNSVTVPSHPPSAYALIPLPDLRPLAVNDAGVIVGDRISTRRPAKWENGNLTDLAAILGGATGINTAGDIVGATFSGSDGRAFRISGGTFSTLPDFGGGSSFARGINDQGDVFGFAGTLTTGTYTYFRQHGLINYGTRQNPVLVDVGPVSVLDFVEKLNLYLPPQEESDPALQQGRFSWYSNFLYGAWGHREVTNLDGQTVTLIEVEHTEARNYSQNTDSVWIAGGAPTNLVGLFGGDARVAAMNNQRQFAGLAYSGSKSFAARWVPDGGNGWKSEIIGPGNSVASAIDSFGNVFGVTVRGPQFLTYQEPMLFADGQVFPMEMKPSEREWYLGVHPVAVNAQGQVIGGVGPGGESGAFPCLWQRDGTRYTFDDLLTSVERTQFDFLEAPTAINSNGVIVGTAITTQFPQGPIGYALVPIHLTADPGKIHHGFDPPNPAEGESPGREPYWVSVIQGQTNNIVNLHLGNGALASNFEFAIKPGDEPFVDIHPKTFTSSDTDLTIQGTAAGGNEIKETTIWLRRVGSIIPDLTIKVLVFPLRSREVGIYTLEDSTSPGTKFATPPAIPIPAPISVISDLDDSFRQAGVRFVAHSSSGAKDYPYDTRGIIGTNFDSTAPARAPTGRMEKIEWDVLAATAVPPNFATLFPADLKLIFIKNSGVLYDNSTHFVRGQGSGSIFVAQSLGYSNLVAAHEIGRNLLADPLSLVVGHDPGPYPPGVEGDLPNGTIPSYPGVPHKQEPNWVLMQAGEPEISMGKVVLPWIHGRWMRHEDWVKCNLGAR